MMKIKLIKINYLNLIQIYGRGWNYKHLKEFFWKKKKHLDKIKRIFVACIFFYIIIIIIEH